MRRALVQILTCAVFLCCTLVGLAAGISNGEKVKFKGLITGRDGDTLL